MKIELIGKKALVTGGTRGIGKAICGKLLEAGAEVLATGTDPRKSELLKHKNIEYTMLDFLDKSSLTGFIKQIEEHHSLDIVINNAGINNIQSIDTIDQDVWDDIIQVNLTGPMLVAKAAAPAMKDRKWGRIVNVSSIWGIIGKEQRNAYAASKTGLIGLTRTEALDLGRDNILVNALCPGITMTELTCSVLSQKEMDKLAQEVPLKRFASVEEIANVALFLCSNLNTYITGQAIVADGGFTIR